DECQGAHAQPRRHQIFDPLEEGTLGSLGPGNVLPAAFAQVVIKPTVIPFAHTGVALLTDAFDHRQPALPGLDQGTIAPRHGVQAADSGVSSGRGVCHTVAPGWSFGEYIRGAGVRRPLGDGGRQRLIRAVEVWGGQHSRGTPALDLIALEAWAAVRINDKSRL